jgi:hypothetical protein
MTISKTKRTSYWIGRGEAESFDDMTAMGMWIIENAAPCNNEERSELNLWLVYRDFGVCKRVAIDDIHALGGRAARTLPNPLKNPIASAEATARLLNDIRATLCQGMQQHIADSERQRWIEVAAMYVDQKTIEVAQRDQEVDEIRVTLLGQRATAVASWSAISSAAPTKASRRRRRATSSILTVAIAIRR